MDIQGRTKEAFPFVLKQYPTLPAEDFLKELGVLQRIQRHKGYSSSPSIPSFLACFPKKFIAETLKRMSKRAVHDLAVYIDSHLDAWKGQVPTINDKKYDEIHQFSPIGVFVKGDKSHEGCKAYALLHECELGRGSEKVVRLAIEYFSGTLHALYWFDYSDERETIIKKEIDNAIFFRNQKWFLKVEFSSRITHRGNEYIIAMVEYADGGNLIQYKEKMRLKLKLLDQLEICRQIFEGLEFLHGHGSHRAHNDMKPENIMIVNGQPKIGDLSMLSNKDDVHYRGTPKYRPPEEYRKRLKDLLAKDIYGATMACWKFLCDEDYTPCGLQHSGDSWLSSDTYKKRMRESVKDYEEPSKDLPISHLLWEGLQTDPKKRPTAAEMRKRFEDIIEYYKKREG